MNVFEEEINFSNKQFFMCQIDINSQNIYLTLISIILSETTAHFSIFTNIALCLLSLSSVIT